MMISPSEDKYIIMDEDTTIGCPRHGDFLATPDEHLKGYGCPICRHEDVMSKIKDINDYLDYCIVHEGEAQDNYVSIKSESYSRVIHDMYGKTKKILDEFVEIRGKSNV